MNKARKALMIIAVILFPLGMLTFALFPIFTQILYGEGFLHVDYLLASSVRNFPEIASGLMDFELYPLLFVILLALIIIFIPLWITFAAIKKTKSGAAIFFGSLIYLLSAYMLLVFVFDTNDIGTDMYLEFSRNGTPLVMYLIEGTFDNLFNYSMLASFGMICLSFLLVFIAMLTDIFYKKKVEKTASDTPQVNPVTPSEPKSSGNDLYDLLDEKRRLQSRINEIDQKLVSNQPQPVEQEIEKVETPLPVVESEPNKEETPQETAPVSKVEDKQPEFDMDDPFDRIFANVEVNREELDDPFLKKGEIRLENEEEAEEHLEDEHLD